VVSKKSQTKNASQDPDLLTGWQQIADFLGQPVSVAERWATEGMPVRKQGRSMTANRHELTAWLGRESGEPVHVMSEELDLSAELRRGLAHVRSTHASKTVGAKPRKVN
jgi:hypothetical protein